MWVFILKIVKRARGAPRAMVGQTCSPILSFFSRRSESGPKKGPLGPILGHLGAPWGYLGASWDILGRSWNQDSLDKQKYQFSHCLFMILRPILCPFSDVLGPSLGHLGPILATLGLSSDIFVRIRTSTCTVPQRGPGGMREAIKLYFCLSTAS